MGNKLLKIDCFTLSNNLNNEEHKFERQHSISSNSHSHSATKSISKSTVSSREIHCASPQPQPQPRECIKVLFLDVDGVLNTINTRWDNNTHGIEDNLLEHLKLILDSTECKIVLSTSWRLSFNYKHILLYILSTRGNINIDEIIIGETSQIPNCTRSTEILRFIYSYNSNEYNKYYISQFCAIDDLPLNTYPNSAFLNHHFVKTNQKIGLSMGNVNECIQILNQNRDYYKGIFPKSP